MQPPHREQQWHLPVGFVQGVQSSGGIAGVLPVDKSAGERPRGQLPALGVAQAVQLNESVLRLVGFQDEAPERRADVLAQQYGQSRGLPQVNFETGFVLIANCLQFITCSAKSSVDSSVFVRVSKTVRS